MKTKFLFASLFASAVMVGCSNEELPVAQDAATDNLALIFDGFGGVESVDSRMTYDNGSFKWVNGDEIGVSRVAGKGVTTNYLFKAAKVTDDNTKPLDQWNESKNAANKYAYFTTDFGTIFKGDYVVYFPYDENFCEDGKIVAKLNIGQTEVNGTATKTAHVAADGFMMSPAVAFEGGQKAEKFPLYPVFGRLVMKIKNADGGEIETIVLRSLNGKTLPTEMEIDADVKVSSTTGMLDESYMHVVESSKVEEIVMSVDGDKAIASGDGYEAYFTVIPGTYSNFAIDVITDKGVYTKKFNAATIHAGNRAEVKLEFTAADMTLSRAYYVTSEASWKTVMEKIAASMTEAEGAPATIKVMSDVSLAAKNFRPSTQLHKLVPVTVEGPGSITVEGDAGRDSKSDNALTNVTFNIPVKVDGKFGSVPGENVTFAKGLEATNMYLDDSESKYTIKGGKIGETTIATTSKITLTVDDVKFTGLVTSGQTADLDGNGVAKVNFNNCTFEAGLTNTAGSIRVDGATIVEPNANNDVYSKLNVTDGSVYVKNTITVEDVDVKGVLNLENGSTAINHSLAAITGTINVKQEATLTLGQPVNYTLNNKIKLEGKLVNNGTLTADKELVLDDISNDNNNKGTLVNNGVVRLNETAFDSRWYDNQNIEFENNAHYNIIVNDEDEFKKGTDRAGITGVEVLVYSRGEVALNLKGKGNNGNVIDFSGLNLVLNSNQGSITAKFDNGTKFKNIEVKGKNDVTLKGNSNNAVITAGDLSVSGKLTMTKDNANNAKAKVANVTVSSTGVLANGAQVTYTGSFTNNGTVSGGNPVK